MGKSTIAKALCHHIQFRRIFTHGVIYLEMKKKTKVKDLFELLYQTLFSCEISSDDFNENHVKEVFKLLETKIVLICIDNID